MDRLLLRSSEFRIGRNHLLKSHKLEKLLEQKAQLNARIQKESARLSAQARKERTGRLVAWGVVIEQMILNGSITSKEWEAQCHVHLQGRTLDRALRGEWKN